MMNQAISVSNSEIVNQTPSTPLYQKILVMMGMMTLMAGTLTGVMTYMNIGLDQAFYSQWLQAFLTAALVMAPLGFGTMTLLTKAMEKVLPNASESKRNILIGLIMAVFMESMMALTTAATNIGFADSSALFEGWLSGFLAALPVGLGLMILVSTTIKPKVERFLKS
jgi:cation transport ATPase